MTKPWTPVRRKGLVLLVGGAVVALLPSLTSSYSIIDLPFSLGVVYVVAALAAGQKSPLWSAAVVLLFFGIGVELLFRHHLPSGVDEGPAEVAAIGVGLVAAELLRRAGYAIDLLGVALAVVFVAIAFTLQRDVGGAWGDPKWYGVGLAVYGALELRPQRR